MAPKDQPIPYELQRLIDLGKQKKLYRLVIVYNVHGEADTKLMDKKNMEVVELMNFREDMFRFGFKVMIEPGHWKIICPMDIVAVDLYRQDSYFFDAPFNSVK